jgi:hypothetical protein
MIGKIALYALLNKYTEAKVYMCVCVGGWVSVHKNKYNNGIWPLRDEVPPLLLKKTHRGHLCSNIEAKAHVLNLDIL